jgi:hypothetical protein
MTWAMSPRVRSSIGTLVMAGVLIAIPTAAVSVQAYAAPVRPAPPPADPPTNAPHPPPPPVATQPGHGEYYSTNDSEDWWPYAGTGSF